MAMSETDMKAVASGGVLGRLARDKSGNTIAMFCAALIPLIGMTGSAVDVGRSYLIKTRLQQACDAGVLAGRRTMSGATVDSSATGPAQTFFKTNMTATQSGAENVVFNVSSNADGEVLGSASARVPMAMMQFFGYKNMDVSVRCDAKLEIPNTDVVLVLDTTGSMNCAPADQSSNSNATNYCPNGNNNGAEKSDSKIVSLRQSVKDFFQTVNGSVSANAQFRIGFVPYASAVNLGIDPFTNQQILPTSWTVNDKWKYQSRLARMDKQEFNAVTTFGAWTNETFASNITNSHCTSYGNNQAFSTSTSPAYSYTPANTTASGTANSNPNNAQQPTGQSFDTGASTDVRRVYARVSATWSGSGRNVCQRRWRLATTTNSSTGKYYFRNWDYTQEEYDISSYRNGTTVQVYKDYQAPTGSVTTSGVYNMAELITAPGSTVVGSSTTFDGCFEERTGIAQASFSTIPAGSHDLNILSTPTSSNDTKWRPMWPDVVYNRTEQVITLSPFDADYFPDSNNYGKNAISSTSTVYTLAYSACPAESSKLAVRTAADVASYVGTLEARGGTYHDLGMAWGARFIMPTGLWASENASAPNGRPISRHIIFMTDGMMAPGTASYSSQGIEEGDRRVLGSASFNDHNDMKNQLLARHNARFLALCDAARAQGVTVWTINFSTSTQSTLTSCADTGKAYQAADAATLQAAYQAIAKDIAELRLSN